MMQKVSVKDPGDTRFLDEDRVAKKEFFLENERISKMAIVNNNKTTLHHPPQQNIHLLFII